MKKKVTAIGEILWDLLPEGKKAGGSSMNVALHLHKQNIDSCFISAIGNDSNGKELIQFLNEQNFPTSYIQIHPELPTSVVHVSLNAEKQASYTIVEPVAWDAIQLHQEAIETVKQSDALVYCSLTCRNEISRKTILSLLKEAKLKIFDINLRPPFFTIERLKQLLEVSDILKINDEELFYLRKELSLTGNTNEQLVKQLSSVFNIQTVCLTLGEKGAAVLHEDCFHQHPGYPVKVADTVGAGDSFLATFIANYLEGYPMDTVLDRACKVGAFVASQFGANPAYDSSIYN
ncbi:carbohydrate kinase family protein [Pedobacter sp. MW01-1-1]|uniref:carbohydrate kinase family protein n=1 Tax=Pedobacter sp. MW01-1-1 TaxID=3383027 RepID=UPI003FF037CD